MKTFLKILSLVGYIFLIVIGSFYSFIGILCGGDGVGYLNTMLLVAVLFGFGFFTGLFKGDKKDDTDENNFVEIENDKKISSTNKQLVSYIYFARKKGLTDDEITENLINQGGGNVSEIENAFDLIK